jgi:hypothetical protein
MFSKQSDPVITCEAATPLKYLPLPQLCVTILHPRLCARLMWSGADVPATSFVDILDIATGEIAQAREYKFLSFSKLCIGSVIDEVKACC